MLILILWTDPLQLSQLSILLSLCVSYKHIWNPRTDIFVYSLFQAVNWYTLKAHMSSKQIGNVVCYVIQQQAWKSDAIYLVIIQAEM